MRESGETVQARETPGAVSSPAKQRSILVLVADPGGREYLSSVLQRYRVTLSARPDEVADLLRRQRYSLVIITNLGLPPWLALEAIEAERDFPVLFLSGHVDAGIESICLQKRIPWLRVPDELKSLPHELRVALEDLNA